MNISPILKSLLLVPFSIHLLLMENLPPGTLQTARALHTNRALLKNLPLYTCLETISRSRLEGQHRKPAHTDVVQVDVGVGANQEIYSWPGQPTFSQQDLSELVPYGLLSTGLFYSFATNLFFLDHGIVRFDGQEDIRGNPALRFKFTIPSLNTQWEINWHGVKGTANERGTFWVDKDNYTLLKLNVQANNISANLALKELAVSIDYQRLTFNKKLVLLPKQAQLLAEDKNGRTLQNEVGFSNCHVFEADSRLADSGQDINTALERYESNRALLPAGLMLKMSLKTPVRAAVAKVGDRIEARLNYPVKISAKTIAPSGSIVSGHIREFEKLHDPPDTFVVGLEFDTLEWQERSYTFLAELIRMQQLPGLTGGISRYSSRISNSSVGTMYLDTRETFSLITIPGTVTFFLQNASDLPTGFQMIWRTQNLKRR